MRKYLIKLSFFFIIFVLSVTSAATIYLNLILAKSKNGILQKGQKYFAAQRLSVENAIYLPPHFIIIQNAFLLEESASARGQLMSVPLIVARFSLQDLLEKKGLSLSGISLYRPEADYERFYNFLHDNWTQILEFIKQLPRQDFGIAVKEARLEQVKGNGRLRHISANFFLRLKNGLAIGYGTVSSDTGAFTGIPFYYRFKGLLKDNGFSLENAECVRKNSYAKLWGDFSGSVLSLNGFAFIDTLSAEAIRQKGPFNIKEYLLRPATQLPGIDLSKVNVNILDIDFRLKTGFPHFEIERLNFTLNNNPVSVKANLAFSRPVALDIHAFLSQSQKSAMENPKRLELYLRGILEHDAFRGEGRLNFDFVKKKKANPPLERLELDFKQLILFLSGYPRLSIAVGELSLLCATETNTYSMLLNDAHAGTALGEGREKFVKFHSSFYDGLLKGWGRLDTGMHPARITSGISVKGVSANKLKGLLIHFSKVYGKLSGQMNFSTSPDLALKGAMVIHNGYLRDFEFFKWLADFFALEALRRIEFERALANFTIDTQGASLHDIELGSKDVGLGGYFGLGANDLVSSKISLSLTKELLGESSKFSRLLKLVGQDLNLLRFNFQLSGILHAINFQWLKSDLKKELQDKIPNFIERRIERGIEEAIESVSEKDKTSGQRQ